MKIILVSEFFPKNKEINFSGGVEARTFFVAKNLAKNNQVIVLTSILKGSVREEQMYGFRVLRVGPNRSYQATTGDFISRLKFIKHAIKEAKKIDAEIVEGSNFLAHFIAKEIARHKNIPAVAWYPDVWLGEWFKNVGFLGIVGEILERLNLARGFNKYIAISNNTAVKLKKYVKNKIEVIYCGVELEEFNKKVIKKDTPTIISIARLAAYKNHRVLLQALAELNKKIESNLVIVGQGPEENSLKKLAKELNIEGRVEFCANLNRDQLIKKIMESHIFSLPSLVEGFGIATVEAAAAGLPFVNSNIEVQKEVTKDGKGGFLVDAKDYSSFAEKFYQLLTDKDLYNNKSREARKLAEDYDWKKISEQTERVYKSLI